MKISIESDPIDYFATQTNFSVSNNFASDSFRIIFKWLFEDLGNAIGGELDSAGAFLAANVAVDDEVGTFFSSEAGNLFGGPLMPSFSNVGMTTLELLLAPGESGDLISIHDTSGQVLSVGASYRVDIQSFISIDSVERLSVKVPEPAILALFGLGLAGLAFTRRKKA